MFRFLFDKDTWQELRESLTKNKLRTIITMIGVWWGILLLIGLLGSAKGIENKTTRGSNKVLNKNVKIKNIIAKEIYAAFFIFAKFSLLLFFWPR